jgi:hypothetical protein
VSAIKTRFGFSSTAEEVAAGIGCIDLRRPSRINPRTYSPAVDRRSLRTNDENTSPTKESNCSSTRTRPAASTSRFSQRRHRKPLRHTDLTKYY